VRDGQGRPSYKRSTPCLTPSTTPKSLLNQPQPPQEDYVELGGVRIHKPFVEKPASGEDHNVYIYYPHSMVGCRGWEQGPARA
jgi:hypothetical protein